MRAADRPGAEQGAGGARRDPYRHARHGGRSFPAGRKKRLLCAVRGLCGQGGSAGLCGREHGRADCPSPARRAAHPARRIDAHPSARDRDQRHGKAHPASWRDRQLHRPARFGFPEEERAARAAGAFRGAVAHLAGTGRARPALPRGGGAFDLSERHTEKRPAAPDAAHHLSGRAHHVSGPHDAAQSGTGGKPARGGAAGVAALAFGPHAYSHGRAAAAQLGGKSHDRPRFHRDAA